MRVALDKETLKRRDKALRASLSPDQNPNMTAFPVAEAHALYRELRGLEAERLADVKTLFVVADGPLESLPLSVLVTEAPPAGPTTRR